MTESPSSSPGAQRPAGRRSIDNLAYPPDVERAEAGLVAERRNATRTHLNPDTYERLPSDTIGFGLSGGGVRSAIFSLGVFQAMANARMLGRIDFLSTVSGGGYFGSFLGRLYTRPWVTGVDDVERAIVGKDPEPKPAPADPAAEKPIDTKGFGARLFRWLRDNGRYLAPRGSGDVLLLGALLLRNWLAVQLVLIVSVMTLFATLQIVRVGLEALLASLAPRIDIPYALVCSLPLGNSVLWWSPWIVTPVAPLALIAMPAGWSYWFIRRNTDGEQGIPAWIGAAGTVVLAGGGIVYYQFVDPGHDHGGRLAGCWLLAITATISLVVWRAGEHRAERWRLERSGTMTESGNYLRNVVTQWLKSGLVVTGLLLAWALVDTAGGTLYAVSSGGQLAKWSGAIISAFGAVGAFARPLALMLAPKDKGSRPGVTISMASWAAAIVVMTVWFGGMNVGSHALRWNMAQAAGVPIGMRPSPPPAPTILGADSLEVEQTGLHSTITARVNGSTVACALPPDSRHAVSGFLGASVVVLGLFSLLFARTRTFANLSSVHGFYTARLTRTFLGASNEGRLGSARTAVSDAVQRDDVRGSAYWKWPLPRGARMQLTSDKGDPPYPWSRGGPLHIVNTTVNETVDARSGIQNQDRKGTGLAISPCCLSLGIRHHLLHTPRWTKSFPSARRSHRVFSRFKSQPEWLTLGRWMSISGAAFTAAAGANTTVPIAILSGMFNVRLGYWWDSGTSPRGESLLSRWFPVQSALFAEMLARTPGTARRHWILSDGGHFENMAGYELIRRRLPVIVIVDAEADPDYTFQGLSDLVRKARLDFGAEIVFLGPAELDLVMPEGSIVEAQRGYFGDLDALRRGAWKSEQLTDVHGKATTRFTIEPDRTRSSKAHAALARVVYGDPNKLNAEDPNERPHESWLVYVKATLMGDEPEDVCHYHRSHPDFPQESTLDQFFDEAQWESYRRLGQHVGHRVLTQELLEQLVALRP